MQREKLGNSSLTLNNLNTTGSNKLRTMTTPVPSSLFYSIRCHQTNLGYSTPSGPPPESRKSRRRSDSQAFHPSGEILFLVAHIFEAFSFLVSHVVGGFTI
jgi:hypothetical protein